MDDEFQPKLWYEGTIDTTLTNTEPYPEDLLIALKEEAKKCYDNEVANYNIKKTKTNSDHRWIKTVMSKGAVADRIAACVIAIQDSPVHSLDTLANLIGMVKVSKKKECIIVIDSLVDLCLENLLPSTRKLIPFRQRPLQKLTSLSSGNALTRKKYLTYWHFEDHLKELYTSLVLALNTFAQDTVDTNKEKAISAMYKLLAGNSEQEKNLLVYIVNKIGDPSKKVASKTIYCLTKLLDEHSNMQGVVLNEVEKLLFRTNISPRAQYYALCFLSQYYLSHDNPSIAVNLIDVYFSFFKACVKKGEVNSRTMSALLMGVNRAFPYAKLDLDKIADNINTIYRIVHIANFNISIHALMLLFHVSNQSSEISDRFYSALYRKLLDPQISNTTHHAMLLNLVYKTLTKDSKANRVKVIVKRLLQVATTLQASVATGILYVVSQVVSRNPEMASIILKPQEGTFSNDNDDQDEEKYYDIKDEENTETVLPDEIKPNTPGWVHCKTTKEKVLKRETKYDALNRNPLYGGGQFSAYTELLLLKCHYHPTVSLFASNLLNGERIKYNGDFLKDFSLIRFLDRFVYKNPKKTDEVAKIGYHSAIGKRKSYVPSGARSLAVTSYSYLNKDESKIPVDEQFLHKYFKRRTQNQVKPKHEGSDDESDADSVNSEEFESMLGSLGKDEDEELNFMDAVGNSLKKKSNNVITNDDDDDAVEDEEDDLDDDDIDYEDDASDIVFDDDSDMEDTKTKKKKKISAETLFASAEEFAALLEDEGASKIKPGGSNAFANKDNANLKQITWEENRNRWIKGYNDIIGNNKGKSNKKRKAPQKKVSNKKKKVR